MNRFELGQIGTNCYVVRADDSATEAVVVDPGAEAPRLLDEISALGARCTAILVTHGHWDHLGGVADLAEATGAPVHMAEDERRSISTDDGARILLVFAPWPGEGHYRGDVKAGS